MPNVEATTATETVTRVTGATITLTADEVAHLREVLECQLNAGYVEHDEFAMALKSALDAPPADDRPIQVGDRVRVVEDDPLILSGRFIGLVGSVVDAPGPENNSSRLRFKVEFAPGVAPRDKWWCTEVERVTD